MMFQKGSIIKRPVQNAILGILFAHMGIYIGEGEVIHFSGERKIGERGAVVVKTTLEEFESGIRSVLHAAPKNQKHARAVCKAAESLHQDKENQFNGQYNFIFHNCEDFCIYCYEISY